MSAGNIESLVVVEPKKMTTILVFVALALAFAGGALAAEIQPAIDDIEYLGNPFKEQFDSREDAYARNIWDLQPFQGLLFMGAGNSSNRGPARNSGSIPLVYFDPQAKNFRREGTIREEQIDRFRILDRRLYIPGHDPMESWRLGNVYERLQEGYWAQYRNIPGALHSYDMIAHRGNYYLALGLKDGAAIGVSSNEGMSWRVHPMGGSRAYSFLKVADKLYAAKKIKALEPTKAEQYTAVFEVASPDELIPRGDLLAASLFPMEGLREHSGKKLIRAERAGSATVYIGAYTHNDHHSEPFGVFVAHSLTLGELSVSAVPISEGSTPWDILVDGDHVYVLLSRSTRENSSWFRHNEIFIIRSAKDDLMTWHPYMRFPARSFARSFARIGGYWYFGLGTEVEKSRDWKVEELNQVAGDIIRVSVPVDGGKL